MYKAEVLADSLNPAGVRLTTLLVRFPRIVLAEFNTHRMLSRNSASSRAIPVEKRIAAVRADPFVPEAFSANQRGMQAGEALDEEKQLEARRWWTSAQATALQCAAQIARIGVHKQWANRLIEPFAWHEVIVTATEWSNFFHLRISEHAQPEIRRIAEMMRDAMAASTPRPIGAGDWHLPLVREEDYKESLILSVDEGFAFLAKLSVARCARVSYLTHDNRRDPAADIALHDKLLENGHMSPFEHAARAEGDVVMRGNFRGFTQYRKLIPREADRLAPAGGLGPDTFDYCADAPSGTQVDDATGFNVAPVRYSAHGRETVDRMRDMAHAYADGVLAARATGVSTFDVTDPDALANLLFAYACHTHAMKYRDRAGLKGDATQDFSKADWWDQMAEHIEHGTLDPRASRAAFRPYVRPSK